MIFNTLVYEEPVFRPPAEAGSAILQATIGCSWNKCAFCEMYSTKKYCVRPVEELRKEVETLFEHSFRIKRFFLADGDAFSMNAEILLELLNSINTCSEKSGNRLQRISSYALPKNILTKTSDELKALRESGLKLLYIGIETGDDELLSLINKGETYQTTLEGVNKAHNAGIDTSIMIINGLGGKNYSEQHAKNSAKIINELNPRFLSTLTLSFPFGVDKYKSRFKSDYMQQTTKELVQELYMFLSMLEVDNTIFRSNHVSNNVCPQGTFPKDKQRVLDELKYVISNTPDYVMPKKSHFL